MCEQEPVNGIDHKSGCKKICNTTSCIRLITMTSVAKFCLIRAEALLVFLLQWIQQHPHRSSMQE